LKRSAADTDARAYAETMARPGVELPAPLHGFGALAGRVAVYAPPMDACEVDGEVVTPQPGRLYGGWITSAVAGPFKGVPDSRGW
jgi:hypothetical protein